MKKKRIIMIVVAIILILCMAFVYWIYQMSNDNMDYKFENDKLYITKNSKEWIEVPGNFSYTIKHLNEEHKGKYNEGTYQLNNKKIVFYAEVPNNGSSYDGKYMIYIIYSNDKGKTWEDNIIGSSDYRDSIISIRFKNKDNGEMTLKTRANIGNYNYITKDGGKEWMIEHNAEYELTNAKLHYVSNLNEIPKNITPSEAAERGYFVYDGVQDKTYNEEILNEFVKNTEMNAENRIKSEIIIAIYDVDGNLTIYNLGYKYNENMGYVLAKDSTRIRKNNLEDTVYMVVDSDFPSEYYGITVKDSGFSSKIISLTSYSENYEDIEIARYVSK